MELTQDVITARTADGVSLALQHITPVQGASRGAVVLQHGLGANALTLNFPGRSLAAYLAAQGFDCYVPELRGAGASDRPARYGLDEYLEQDVPAIIDAVQRASGQRELGWVGHSMGGILLMLYGIEHPDVPVKRFVAIGSALDYRPGKSVHRETRALRPLAGNWLSTLPFGSLTRLNGLVAGKGPLLPAEKMNFWRRNMEPALMRCMLTIGFDSIPMDLLDDLSTTFDDVGLSRKQGTIVYLPRAHEYTVPTLLIGGSRDVQATPESITETARLLSGVRNLEVARFGKPHGHADDYGHVDLVVGRHVGVETWPAISEFLSR